MEMTLEQKRAIALASARLRLQQQGGGRNATGQDGSLNAENTMRALGTGIPVLGGLLNKLDAATNATLAPVVDPLLPDDFQKLPGETWGERYNQALDIQQSKDKAFQEEHPYVNTGLNIAGGVAATVPLIAAAPAAFGAGGGTGLGGLAKNIGAGAMSGAGIGAADAGVRSDYDPSAMKQGLMYGGMLGGAAPIAGRAIGKGIAALTGPSPSRAQQAFTRAAAADGVDDVPARLAQMGPDAMPMDLGPNLQSYAGALAGTPGRAQEMVRSAVSQRQAGAGQRVSSSLDDALGQNVDTVALADDIIARRSAAAKPLYDAAYSKPVPFSKELEELLRRPTVGKALKKAQGLAADEGITSQQWFANVSDDGSVALRNVPDVRQLDLTKRALDDMISSAQRAGNNNEARIFIQQKDLLTKMVDKAVPEYAQARKAFSGPAAVLDALEEGRAIFKNQMTPNQIRTQLLKMGDAEREAFVQGGRSAIADTMGTARNDALKGIQTFESGYNKEKLALLVGKDQADQMLKSLDAERAFRLSRDSVTGNSETFARAQAMKYIGANAKEPGVIRELLNMQAGSAAAKLGDKTVGRVQSASQQKVNEELARYLTVKPGNQTDLKQAIDAIRAAQRRKDITADQALKFVVNVQGQFARKVSGPETAPRVLGQEARKPLEITIRPNR
ncbi:hypothetical protein [Phyllobacterium leguminum]|uniref:Uncharacterized protein n=1 Tax=Phyllobacterium leguminum TaxID=314237 RepID=A0A318T6W5_9HYPH|nr:hypothetical protein [Phyllobacterium leguminum]PYE88767.1 hypothetical protein C7477_106140 [Phyllobacterium leguminum]